MLASLWLLVWLALFANCLRTQRLLPVAGSTKRARILWSLSFLLVNPVFALLYLTVGREGRLHIARPQWRTTVGAVGITVALWLQFFAGGLSSPEVIAAGSRSRLSLAANAHWFSANSTVINRGTYGAPAVGSRRIRVVHTDDRLSRAIATQVAHAFADQWWAETVELWPRNRAPELGALAPDRYIDIDASDVITIPTPIIQAFHGRVLFQSSQAPSHMGAWPNNDSRIRLGQAEVSGDLDISFARAGTALGTSFYGEPAQVVSDKILSSLLQELNANAERFGFVTDPPGVLAHTPVELPDALAKLKLMAIDREYARYLHERARFTFEDRRDTASVLADLAETLRTEGWGINLAASPEGERGVLSGNKDDVHLTIGRWPMPAFVPYVAWSNGEKMPRQAEPICESPFLIVLEYRFTDDELGVILNRSMEAPIDFDTVRALQALLTQEQWKTVSEHLHSEPRPFARDWLMLTKAHQEQDDTEAAIRALRVASQLASFDEDREAQKKVTSVADELEVKLKKRLPYPDYEFLVAAGFTPLDLDAIGLDLRVGQTARFVSLGSAESAVTLTLGMQQLRPSIEYTMNIKAPEASGSISGPRTPQSSTIVLCGVYFTVEAAARGDHAELIVRRDSSSPTSSSECQLDAINAPLAR